MSEEYDGAGRSAYELPDWRGQEELQTSNGSAAPGPDIGRLATPSSSSPEDVDYVQHYDVRGHPENTESRDVARRSRRAQNDVLSTIGVCVNVDRNGRLLAASSSRLAGNSMETFKILSIKHENGIGLCLSAVDLVMFFFATVSTLGLKNRLQTFSLYSGISLVQICRVEWKYFGALKYIFAGAPAILLYSFLEHSRLSFLEAVSNTLTRWFVRPDELSDHQQKAKTFIYWIEEILQAATIVMISQLKIFAMLQWLDLAPAWPLLPNPRFLIPFTSTSPIQIPLLPAQWTPRTFVAYVISLGSSPLLLCAAHRHIDNVLVSKLLEYAQIAFPRPENPDMCSIKAARDADLDDATVPGLGFSIEHGVFKSRPRLTLFGVIKKDFQAAIRRLLATGEDMRQRVNGMLTKPLADEGGTRVSLIRSNEAEEETLQEQSITPLGLSPAAEGPTDTTEISFSADVNPSRVPVEGSSTATPSPQLSATEDEDIVTSEPGNTFVQIRTRAGSTDTLHMNVEINGAIPGAPTYTSSFSASPRPTIIQSTMTQAVDEPRHRVTVLTAHAAEALGQHLVSHLTDLILIPLESALLRSIALAFLSAPTISPASQAASLRLKGIIYPINSWFGLGLRGGWRSVGDYIGKMFLCMGIETVFSFGVWQVGMGVAWWLGKTRYQWGRL
ncbi:hypothetical protein MMC24_000941 [Lignoscripta atroalba]|nr:hypothetical protein [Lignoscripta atroalba]